MALPTLVDCVLLANTTAMLMLGSIAFAPSMAPDGELGKRLRKTNATQMGGLVMRFLAVSAWSLAALTSVCYVGRRPVPPSALVTLCSFHAAAAAVLLLDPNCSWIAEVGGDFGRLWGYLHAGMALGFALVGLGGGGKNKRGVRDAASAAKAPSKKTQ